MASFFSLPFARTGWEWRVFFPQDLGYDLWEALRVISHGKVDVRSTAAEHRKDVYYDLGLPHCGLKDRCPTASRPILELKVMADSLVLDGETVELWNKCVRVPLDADTNGHAAADLQSLLAADLQRLYKAADAQDKGKARATRLAAWPTRQVLQEFESVLASAATSNTLKAVPVVKTRSQAVLYDGRILCRKRKCKQTHWSLRMVPLASHVKCEQADFQLNGTAWRSICLEGGSAEHIALLVRDLRGVLCHTDKDGQDAAVVLPSHVVQQGYPSFLVGVADDDAAAAAAPIAGPSSGA